MQATMPEPRSLRWPRGLYERAIEAGVFVGRRVELVGGEIVEMAPEGPRHAVMADLIRDVLTAAFPADRFYIRPAHALALGEWDEPQPDLAVVLGTKRDYLTGHPTAGQTALVIEISDTTATYDLGQKADIYAAAGVADYWVVLPGDRAVVVHRERAASDESTTTWRYARRQRLAAGQAITPLSLPGIVLPVADLLP